VSTLKLKILCFMIAGMLIAPSGLRGINSTRADGGPSLFEVAVSPSTDPDPRDETSIAVSSKNDQVIVGASKVIQGGGTAGRGSSRVGYYFSSDGGQNWGSGLLGLETPQKVWGRASHPAVATDLDGNFYICVLMLDNTSFDTGVYVFKSTDAGRTFGDPTPVVVDIGQLTAPKIADKCYLKVDTSPASRFKNTMYVSWVSREPDRTVILISHRAPGAATFSQPKTISHKGDMRGPSVATGPNGELYAAWEGIGSPRVFLFNASTDGGETFFPSDVAPGADIIIHDFVGSLSDPGAVVRIDFLPRVNSLPVIAVDNSAGPNRGMIYVAWAEAGNLRDADVFVKKLTAPNGGHPNISLPARVNSDTGAADQFLPWLSVDSSNGAVEVAFYDRRDTQGTSLMNLYLARSTDGGAGFGENTRITPVSSDTRIQADVTSTSSAIGIGDYVGLVATGGKAHMLWTDTRRGKQEIFYGQLNFDPSAPPPPPPIGLSGDNCQSPRVIASVPYLETLDTRAATSSADDPVSCTGGRDTNTVWYSFTSSATTHYGIDTSSSDYDTVLSVYTGLCGSLTRVACSDDFGNPPEVGNRSVLKFSAVGGVTYLIEASGKGSGGLLKIRAGYPTITGVEYTSAPDGSDALMINGAGFVSRNTTVTVQLDGEDIVLPNVLFIGPPLPDGTDITLFAWKKKLKKLVKRGSLLVRVESPAGSGNISNRFLFTR
jgi:hypothetical protein